MGRDVPNHDVEQRVLSNMGRDVPNHDVEQRVLSNTGRDVPNHDVVRESSVTWGGMYPITM